MLPERPTATLWEREGKVYATFEHGGETWTVEDFCPHRGGPLSEGILERGQIVCPWHGARFDLETGECTNGVTKRKLTCFRGVSDAEARDSA